MHNHKFDLRISFFNQFNHIKIQIMWQKYVWLTYSLGLSSSFVRWIWGEIYTIFLDMKLHFWYIYFLWHKTIEFFTGEITLRLTLFLFSFHGKYSKWNQTEFDVQLSFLHLDLCGYWIWQSSDVLRICCLVLRDDRRINDLTMRLVFTYTLIHLLLTG